MGKVLSIFLDVPDSSKGQKDNFVLSNCRNVQILRVLLSLGFFAALSIGVILIYQYCVVPALPSYAFVMVQQHQAKQNGIEV